MNVVSMLVASALSAGGPAAAPPLPAAPAPAVSAPIVSTATPGGCGSTGVAIAGGAASACGCDPCASKPGLFDRFRGLFARKSHGCDSCAPAPAPIVHHAPKAHSCDPCSGGHRSGLFGGFLSGFGRKKSGGDCGSCDSCGSAAPIASAPIAPATPLPPAYHGTPVVPPAVIPPAVKPEEHKPLPKDGDKPKDKDGKTLGSIPAVPEITPAGGKTETEGKLPFDSDRRHESRFAHAADYSKLTGQLSYVHADGGLWILRYAPLSEEDANGGSVILPKDSKMKNYREGDLVSVEGEIISKKGSARLAAPLYQVRTISLVDRPLN